MPLSVTHNTLFYLIFYYLFGTVYFSVLIHNIAKSICLFAFTLIVTELHPILVPQSLILVNMLAVAPSTVILATTNIMSLQSQEAAVASTAMEKCSKRQSSPNKRVALFLMYSWIICCCFILDSCSDTHWSKVSFFPLVQSQVGRPEFNDLDS